jgi:purine-binding chemotaxis protein CheW
MSEEVHTAGSGGAAGPPDTNSASGPRDPFLVFSVRAAALAVPAHAVEEIRIRPAATFVPRAPGYVVGMINLRGHAVPVIDLGLFLGLPEPAAEAAEAIEGMFFGRVTVVAAGGMRVGLLCDNVRGVVDLPRESRERPAVIQGDLLHKFALGEVEHAGRIVLLLDLPNLLQAARVGG